MSRRRFARLVLAAIPASLVPRLDAAAQTPGGDEALNTLLGRAAHYALEFRRDLSGIVAEEQYAQEVRNALGVDIILDGKGAQPVHHRDLRSDVLMVRTRDHYIEFRDVFAVDGRPVRDREQRLQQLFLSSTPRGDEQLLAIAQESARYNIGSVYRTINTPTVPLMFLEPIFQKRFRFRRSADRKPPLGDWGGDAAARQALESAVVVRYDETARPTVVRRLVGGGDIQSSGRFWIEDVSGRVLATELIVGDPLTRSTIQVLYGELLPGMLVPFVMRERYVNTTDRAVTSGTAIYGNVRRFDVSVDENIHDDDIPR
jgi:hypothetical protein